MCLQVSGTGGSIWAGGNVTAVIVLNKRHVLILSSLGKNLNNLKRF